MRLEVDLAFDAVPSRAVGAADVRAIDLHTLAGALRSPGRLRRLLRDEQYDEVQVREGELPLSALQAVCLLAVAAVRAERYVAGGRTVSRPVFVARALLRAAIAVPAELFTSGVLALRLAWVGRRRVDLPERTDSPHTALLLRVDTTLRWMGSQVGGKATHFSGVINGLLDNGVEVTVVTAERPADSERARLVEVPVDRVLHVVPGLAFTRYGDALVHAAHTLSGDFVYQRHQLGSNAGLALAHRLGVPLVLEFNGSELWIHQHWEGGKARLAGTLGRLERRCLADASLVVAVSKALRDVAVLQGAAPERVLVNPNGVDVDALAPYRESPPSVRRTRVGLPERPTVGFIGTFGPWHGVKLLPALVEAVPDTGWLIVGDGDLFPEVLAEMSARGVSERVLMTGVLERPQALEMLACCDVCVSPHVPNADGTPFFGSPTKLFEYMGLGKAVVASNLDQIGEILEHERTALLCTPGDVDEAAAAVRRLLGDDPLRDRLGRAALEVVERNYTWTAHARRILDALTGGVPRSSHEC